MQNMKAGVAAALAWGALMMMPSACAAMPDDAQDAPAGRCHPEAGFSPEGSAAALVDRAIDSASERIRLAAYTFTSPDVVRHLMAAQQRGVDVAAVVDERGNHFAASKAALNLLVNAGIPVRTIRAYPIHHDKYMVIDDAHIETGSFNYSTAAARHNSENVLVLWNCPQLARHYLAHWQSRWAQGRAWESTY